MGAATFLMGVLPTYDMVGIWAPVILIILRLIQGLGLGGEWGGALLLAVEYAPKDKRGLFGSIPQMGVTIGMLLGTIALSVMTLLPDNAFMSWGWRIPFILSALLVIFGLWIRKGIEETPSFQQVQERGKFLDYQFLIRLNIIGGKYLFQQVLKLLRQPHFIYSVLLSFPTRQPNLILGKQLL